MVRKHFVQNLFLKFYWINNESPNAVLNNSGTSLGRSLSFLWFANDYNKLVNFTILGMVTSYIFSQVMNPLSMRLLNGELSNILIKKYSITKLVIIISSQNNSFRNLFKKLDQNFPSYLCWFPIEIKTEIEYHIICFVIIIKVELR